MRSGHGALNENFALKQFVSSTHDPPMAARLERPADHPHVAVVTIDRAEKANSLDPPTISELAGAWREIAADAEIRAAVLTGAGNRIFCAGMDMTTTIPLSQRFARGERVAPEEFEAL